MYSLVDLASMTALKALAKPSAPANPYYVYIHGYASVKDGGEGVFLWDNASTVTGNNGTIVTPDAGGTGRWYRVYEAESISVKFFGAVGDGTTDDSVAIRNAIAAAIAGKRAVFFPEATYLVSRDGSTTGCLNLPSGLSIISHNATIKGAANLAANTRVVSIAGVNDVRILGHINIDGNKANQANATEHMHCLFVYNSDDVYVQSIYSYNATGDNISITGTHTGPLLSNRISFDTVRCVTAGRKNFVVEGVAELSVRTAFMDNTLGGGMGGSTGGCLDVEPYDAVTSRMSAHFGYLQTIGTESDFTGTGTQANLNKYVHISIDTWDCTLTAGTSNGNLSYWCNGRVGRLILHAANSSIPWTFQYGCTWHFDSVYIDGTGTDYAMQALFSAGEAPNIRINNIQIERSSGKGIYSSGANISIGNAQITAGAGEALNVYATNSCTVTVDSLRSIDSGLASTGYVVAVTRYDVNLPYVSIGYIDAIDGRGTKAAGVFYKGASFDGNGIIIGGINNRSGLTDSVFFYFDTKFIRTGQTQWLCTGTPESLITAPVGSLATRTDGGATTTLYVKTSGTGNTGWTAK